MIKIAFDEKEALRYFGAKKDDAAALSLLHEAYAALLGEVTPRYILRRYPCRTAKDQVELTGGIIFNGRNLARHAAGSRAALLFAATLGPGADAVIRRMALKGVAKGAAAQAAATAMIETYCDMVLEEEERKLSGGEVLKSRFSPGYGDWPLAEQKTIFRALGCEKAIGLNLTEGLMMVPAKSVTALVPVAQKKEEEKGGAGCEACAKKDCAFRRKG